MNLNMQQFVDRILEGSATEIQPAVVGEPRTDALAGLMTFDDDPDQSPVLDHRFAQLLLEESGFGRGEILASEEIVLGDQRTAQFLPPGATYWPKTIERPYHILLFDLEVTGRELLAKRFFKRTDTLEHALYRVVQDVLEGFERMGPQRAADRRRGAQSDTLCVVSVEDDRPVGGTLRRPAQQDGVQLSAPRLVCFGTKCIETKALETFTIREEARLWPDHALARERLEQVFKRHFEKLTKGAQWQDAFVSGAERRKAEKLLEAGTGVFAEPSRLKLLVRELIDEVAKGFGVKKKLHIGPDGEQRARLPAHALPANHSIAVDPAVARKQGFKNPYQGLRIFDADERLLGYLVYAAKDGADAKELRASLRAHNHFHNVLMVFPEDGDIHLELWQGATPVSGRLTSGQRRSQFEGVGGVVQLLSQFLVVSRSSIESPAHLATELAWRAQHLKALATEELRKEESRPKTKRALRDLLDVFNQALATLTEGQFADAYAQTITYGLLAARWMSSGRKDVRFARKNIHALLPSTSPFLHDLFQRLVNSEFDLNLSWLLDDITSLLSRTMVAEVFHGERDPSIHFYQDFLDAYDPQIRKDQGVYYTPNEVVSYIVRTADATLKERFGLTGGLADTSNWSEFARAAGIDVPDGVDGAEPFVQILDPATGTGTFLLRVIEVIHETMLAAYAERGLGEDAAGREWVKYVRAELLPRLNGFELMMAPYIVSHLRLGLALQQTGFVFGKGDRLRIFLTNTLEMHTSAQLSWIGEHVAEEAKEAEHVKKDALISVVVGNPPYEREPAEQDGTHKGGWVRGGSADTNAGEPLLREYLEVARQAGAGVHLKNIYNLYVYFWRWASWRVFEVGARCGIVSMITASSFYQGPAFLGMRKSLRELADEIRCLDLAGDQRGARVTENVFNIRVPVAITSAIRLPLPSVSGRTFYQEVRGTRAEKLGYCDRVTRIEDVKWALAPGRLGATFVAAPQTAYQTWPALVDMFPWQHSGIQFKRLWPIGGDQSVLEERWRTLVSLPKNERATAFRETTARQVTSAPGATQAAKYTGIMDLPSDAPLPELAVYCYRSFDYQWCLLDPRLADRIRPPLIQAAGSSQVYLTSIPSKPLGAGPAMFVSDALPDMDVFCNRGAKDVLPLWRDPATRSSNITTGFLEYLSTQFGKPITPEDLAAYCSGLLCGSKYSELFSEELAEPGVRVPITRDLALFTRVCSLGHRFIYFHTLGRRWLGSGQSPQISGSSRLSVDIPAEIESYPERFVYDVPAQVLSVGEGEIVNVSAAVFNYSISGFRVVKSWLGYRMAVRAGRARRAGSRSMLDEIRPNSWSFTDDLLRLLWVIEGCVALDSQQETLLKEVVRSRMFTADELPSPTAEQTKGPKKDESNQRSLL